MLNFLLLLYHIGVPVDACGIGLQMVRTVIVPSIYKEVKRGMRKREKVGVRLEHVASERDERG